MREERACPGGCWVITPRSLCPVVPCPNSCPTGENSKFPECLDWSRPQRISTCGGVRVSRERVQNEGSKEFFDTGQVSGTQGWKDLEVTSNLKPTKVGDYG